MRSGARWVVMIVAAGCGTAATRAPVATPAQGPVVMEVEPEVGGPRTIGPGLLRANLVEGRLLLERAQGPTPLLAAFRVCVDDAGAVRATVTRASGDAAFDDEAQQAVATWRFRPFVRDGLPEAVCSDVQFALPPAGGPAPPTPALPAAQRELPPSVVVTGALPPGAAVIAPAPGLAAVRRCRTSGSDDAPTVTLLQSSGDPAVDRALIEEPQTRLVEEAVELAARCWLETAITLPPDEEPALVPVEPGQPHRALEQKRISGAAQIMPSPAMRIAISRAGFKRVMVPVKVCIDRAGRVYGVTLIGNGSGFLAYDLDLANGVAAWRYRPFMIDGTPQRVCSIVQFVYNQI